MSQAPQQELDTPSRSLRPQQRPLDDLDLAGLAAKIWSRKWWVVTITAVVVLAGLVLIGPAVTAGLFRVGYI